MAHVQLSLETPLLEAVFVQINGLRVIPCVLPLVPMIETRGDQ
jgi:hypothetical protein